MIITKTPLRISFIGGGTDNLLKQDFDGCVISTTIDKFVYVGFRSVFDFSFFTSVVTSTTTNKGTQGHKRALTPSTCVDCRVFCVGVSCVV